MYKVVINRCFGGFGLSEKAGELLISRYGIGKHTTYGYHLPNNIERHDKRLIEVIEEIGEEESSDDCAQLYIEDIYTPMYRIDEYDGMETLETPDSYEWVVIEG